MVALGLMADPAAGLTAIKSCGAMTCMVESDAHSPTHGNTCMEIEHISVLGGRGRDGQPEPVARLELRMGDVVTVLGPTGSGKTALINDIALFADGDTPSGRRVLVNGSQPPDVFVDDPAQNPIALITQHTTFLSDVPVRDFLGAHARIRRSGQDATIVTETLAFANELTGEPILDDKGMTELSGGQTRALLIADAVVIGNSPIILLDEIENAGIDRLRALELLKRYRKIFVFVTHDLTIALLSDWRVILRGGAMHAVVARSEEECRVAARIGRIDGIMVGLRNRLRAGERLCETELVAGLHAALTAQTLEKSR
jgi:ABC-type lipoprotein export system ATPase subunit